MLIENLYTIKNIETDALSIKASIFINKENDIFKGHFPDNPVMPGVCMIQIIKELTEKATGKELFMQKASNIKFMAIINPEINAELDLSISYSINDDIIKVKNSTSFNETVALKYNGEFKIVA